MEYLDANEHDDVVQSLIDEGLVVVRYDPDGTRRLYAAEFAPPEPPKGEQDA